MSQSRKTLISLIFSVSALVLAGCGGGNNNNGAPVAPVGPGNCQAGYVYSPQYGCMNQSGCQAGTARSPQGQCVSVTSTTTSCQQTNQGPVVYAGPQYGCLPTLSCPVGQGAYVANNQTTCIPAQYQQPGYGGSSGCPVAQVMTAKGCLPEGIYPCGPGTGFLANRCYPSMMNQPTMPNTSMDDSEDDTDGSYDDEIIYTHHTHTTSCVHTSNCAPIVKVKRGGRVVKYKYPKGCR